MGTGLMAVFTMAIRSSGHITVPHSESLQVQPTPLTILFKNGWLHPIICTFQMTNNGHLIQNAQIIQTNNSNHFDPLTQIGLLSKFLCSFLSDNVRWNK
jgi:hypothetical protein